MLTAQERKITIAELHRLRNDPGVKEISKMLDIMIDEAREANDSVLPDGLLFNQGIIFACIMLKGHIEKGLPTSGR